MSGVQRGAADQAPVDVVLSKELGCVFGLDAAAVLDAHLVVGCFSQVLSEEVADHRMYLFGLRGRRRHASANSPNRLVRPQYRPGCARLNPGERTADLAEDDLLNSVGFALLQGLADAGDRAQAGSEGAG